LMWARRPEESRGVWLMLPAASNKLPITAITGAR